MAAEPPVSAKIDSPCILDEWVPVHSVRECVAQSKAGWDYRRLIQLFGHFFARSFPFPPSAHPEYSRDVELVDQVVRACGARWCISQQVPPVDSVRLTDLACLLGRFCTHARGELPEGLRYRFIVALEHAVTRLVEGPRVIHVRVTCPYTDVAKEELATDVVDYDVSDIWAQLTGCAVKPPVWDASPVWKTSTCGGFSHYRGSSMDAVITDETEPPLKRVCYESRICIRDRIFIMWPSGHVNCKPQMNSWAVAGDNRSSHPSVHFHALFDRLLVEACLPSLSRVPDSSLLCLLCRLLSPTRALALCSQKYPAFLQNAITEKARPPSAFVRMRCAAAGWWEAAKVAWLQYASDTGMYGEYNAILRTGHIAPDLWRAANETVTFIRPGIAVWNICHAVHQLLNTCRNLVSEASRQANEVRLPFTHDDSFVGVPGIKAYRHDLFLKAHRTSQGLLRFKAPSANDPRTCSFSVPWHHMSSVRSGTQVSPRAQQTSLRTSGNDKKNGRSVPLKKKPHKNSHMFWVWFPSTVAALNPGDGKRSDQDNNVLKTPCPECWDVLEWQRDNDNVSMGSKKHPTCNLLGFGCRTVEVKRLLLHLAVGSAIPPSTSEKEQGNPAASWWERHRVHQKKILYKEWQDAMPWKTPSYEKGNDTDAMTNVGQYVGALGALNDFIRHPSVEPVSLRWDGNVQKHASEGAAETLPACLYRKAREKLKDSDRPDRPHPGLIDMHVLQCLSYTDEAAQAVWRASASEECKLPHPVFGNIPLASEYMSVWGSLSQGGGSLESGDTAASVPLEWGGTAFDTNRVYVTFSCPRMTTYSSDGTVKNHAGATFSRSAQRSQGRMIQRTNNNRGGVQQLLLSELQRHLCAYVSDPGAQHHLTRNVPGIVTVNVNYCVDHHGLTNVARIPGKMVQCTRAVKARKFPGVAMSILVPIKCSTRLRIKNIHVGLAEGQSDYNVDSPRENDHSMANTSALTGKTVSASLPCNLHKCCSATYPKASSQHTLHKLVSTHRHVIENIAEIDEVMKVSMERTERANDCPLNFLASRLLSCIYALQDKGAASHWNPVIKAQTSNACPIEYSANTVATGSGPQMPQLARTVRKRFSVSACTPLRLCPIDYEHDAIENRHGPTDRFGRVGRKSDAVLSGHSTVYRSRKGDFVSALYDCTADPSVGTVAPVNGAYAYMTYQRLKRKNLWAVQRENAANLEMSWDTLEMVCQAWTSTAGFKNIHPQAQG